MKKILFILSTFIAYNAYSWNSPNLSSPSNGATNQYTGIGLDWYAVSNSEGYILEFDTSLNFNSPLLITHQEVYINTSGSNSDTYEFYENLYFGQKYYWRVRAYVTGDTSNWSAVREFTTRDNQSLSSPSNGAPNQYTGVGLNWNANEYVDFYDLEFDTSSNFNSPLLIQHTEAYINTSDANVDTYEFYENLYFGQKYYWRVRARNAVDTSGWSTVWDFTTRDN